MQSQPNRENWGCLARRTVNGGLKVLLMPDIIMKWLAMLLRKSHTYVGPCRRASLVVLELMNTSSLTLDWWWLIRQAFLHLEGSPKTWEGVGLLACFWGSEANDRLERDASRGPKILWVTKLDTWHGWYYCLPEEEEEEEKRLLVREINLWYRTRVSRRMSVQLRRRHSRV